MRHMTIAAALLCMLTFGGCVSQQRIDQAQDALDRTESVLVTLHERAALAEKLGATPEQIAVIREQIARAEETRSALADTVSTLKEGEPWWQLGLKILAGAASVTAVFVPKLAAVSRGLQGAVRFADGLKRSGKFKPEEIDEIAEANVNDNEREPIAAARKKAGV